MKQLAQVFVFISIVCLWGCAEGFQVNKTTGGAVAGGALGAGLGAIIGNQTGDPGAGVAIGAAAGTLGGALVGNTLDRNDRETQRQRETLGQQQQEIAENQRLIDELRRRGADVRPSNRGVVVNLPDVLFEFDSFRLTGAAHSTVSDIADVVSTVRNRTVSIEGHTDSVGNVVYNKDLSLNRARTVARKLADKGLPSSRMRVTGYGEGRPIASNRSEAGRARNRRVEIIIEN